MRLILLLLSVAFIFGAANAETNDDCYSFLEDKISFCDDNRSWVQEEGLSDITFSSLEYSVELTGRVINLPQQGFLFGVSIDSLLDNSSSHKTLKSELSENKISKLNLFEKLMYEDNELVIGKSVSKIIIAQKSTPNDAGFGYFIYKYCVQMSEDALCIQLIETAFDSENSRFDDIVKEIENGVFIDGSPAKDIKLEQVEFWEEK